MMLMWGVGSMGSSMSRSGMEVVEWKEWNGSGGIRRVRIRISEGKESVLADLLHHATIPLHTLLGCAENKCSSKDGVTSPRERDKGRGFYRAGGSATRSRPQLNPPPRSDRGGTFFFVCFIFLTLLVLRDSIDE